MAGRVPRGKAVDWRTTRLGGNLPLAFGGFGVVLLDAGTQRLDGGGGEVLAGHLHGGERREHELRQMDVVEADDRDLGGTLWVVRKSAWSAPMAVMSLEQSTAVGRCVRAMSCSIAAMPPSMVWLPSTMCSAGTVRPSSAMDLRKASRRATAERRRSGPVMKAMRAVAERGEVLYGLADALAVIDLEDADVGQVGAGIHKDQRELALHQLLDQLLFNAEGHDGHAIDVALQHAADERLGARRLVVG